MFCGSDWVQCSLLSLVDLAIIKLVTASTFSQAEIDEGCQNKGAAKWEEEEERK